MPSIPFTRLQLPWLLLGLGTTSAFISRHCSHSSSLSLHMSYENAIGVLPPLGFWDPLGLLKDADEDRFDRLRYVEIKHGRISMLAIVGHMITTAGWRFPGEISPGIRFSSIKNGLKALETIPGEVLLIIVAFIGLMEVGFGSVQDTIEENCVEQMESFGWDVETQVNKANIELNNGRAAQMGILALMVHERLGKWLGSKLPTQLSYHCDRWQSLCG